MESSFTIWFTPFEISVPHPMSFVCWSDSISAMRRSSRSGATHSPSTFNGQGPSKDVFQRRSNRSSHRLSLVTAANHLCLRGLCRGEELSRQIGRVLAKERHREQLNQYSNAHVRSLLVVLRLAYVASGLCWSSIIVLKYSHQRA